MIICWLGKPYHAAANHASDSRPALSVINSNPYTILGQLQAVEVSNGRFTNVYSGQTVQVQTGKSWHLPVGREGALGFRSYLPLVQKGNMVVGHPDLVVQSISVAQDQVTVVIQNIGNAPTNAPGGFWVDLYLNPNPVPQRANDTWNGRALYGAAWGVTQSLAPNERVTLTLNDTFYSEKDSHMPTHISAGTAVYAQVDSAHTGTSYGAVQENHELNGGVYNNIHGPIFP